MKNVRAGGKLFFINSRGSPHRVFFCADFVDDPLVSVDQAWQRFGQELGVASETEWDELAARLPAIKLQGRLRVIRGSNMRAPSAPILLRDAGIEEKLSAKKGWSIDETEVQRLLGLYTDHHHRPDTVPPEEVLPSTTFPEGAVERVLVNRYERDPRAREACIAKYGTLCYICGFDFVAKYGEVMSGFIHVHHLKSLARLGPDYEVDPERDLRPVCPNCQAVLHRKDPPYSIEDVVQFIRLQATPPNQARQPAGHAKSESPTPAPTESRHKPLGQ
jgi:predicted HNH restriction endonuclease